MATPLEKEAVDTTQEKVMNADVDMANNEAQNKTIDSADAEIKVEENQENDPKEQSNFKNTINTFKDGVSYMKESAKGKIGKLKVSLEELKNVTKQNSEARSGRSGAFNSDDVLLEKNMLLFLDDLLRNLFGKNEQTKTIEQIKDAIKENENLSKEQLADKIRDKMMQSTLLSQEKVKMNEMLNNEMTQDFIQKIYNFKVNEISEITKSSLPEEEISKKITEATPLNITSIIRANDNNIIEQLKPQENEVAEKTLDSSMNDIKKEVTKEVVKNLVRVS